MYGMTYSGYLFSNELTNWMIYEAGFNQSKFKFSIYYKYAPDGSKLVVLSYVDEFVYVYKSEELVKWFLDTLRKRLHMNFPGYTLGYHNLRTILFQFIKIDMLH